ncbi:unnamed protein product [Prunus brigantina]
MDQHKTDDNLHYVGGLTRVLAVNASISFAAALKKLFFEEWDTPNSAKSFYNSEGGLIKEIFLYELISDASDVHIFTVYSYVDCSFQYFLAYFLWLLWSYKYADLFKEKLGICLDKEDEMDCLVVGSNFLLKAVHTEAFTYMDGQKEFVQIDHDDLYPYMLVNIGSGVSMIKVDGPGKFERVSGTNVGEGIFWGLQQANFGFLGGCGSNI